MVKHTQTIRQQQPTKCLNVFGHFVGLAINAKKYFAQLFFCSQLLYDKFS